MNFKLSQGINQRIQNISSKHLVVGIDIAKESHVASAVDCRGIYLGPSLSFRNDQSGYYKLMQWAHNLQKKYDLTRMILGVESTGHYFLNLATWLHNHGEKIVIVNPMTTKRNKENRDNKPSKNDYKDSIIIADSISRGFYTEWVYHPTVIWKLRCLVDEREALSTDLAALSNQLQAMIDHVFPEFNKVFKEWDSMRGFSTLRAFPLPSDIKGLNVQQIIDGWRKVGMRRAGGESGQQQAARLLNAAGRSVGLTDTAPEMKRRMKRLIERYDMIQEQMKALDEEIQALMPQVPQETVHPCKELGLSPWLTAVLIANVGDLRNYEHGKQLLALAGLNLSERSSGKFKGQIKISKRGRRQLRKYLYIAMIGLVANHDSFKRWHHYNVYTLKMKRQKSIFKLIGKLTRILVSLAHSGETFQEGKASPLFAEVA